MGEKPNEPDKIWKEIAELKESQENDHMVIKNLVSSLDILGEQQEALHQAITNESIVNLRLEEVLRVVVRHGYISVKRRDELLEKLDSDPVQKRIDRLDAGGKILKKHEEALNSKASGGEKDSDSLKIGLQNVGKHSIDKTEDGGSNPPHDSKLPEVKYIACRFCKSSNIEHQGWGNEHCYFCNDCKKTCKSPLEITRKELNEPEKDDEIVMIPMTKIALETFAKEIEKKLIEEFIRIVADLYYRDNNLAFMEAKQELEGRLNK